MIIGGYSLHLYCDNVDTCRCLAKRSYQNEFHGRNITETAREARKVGWELTLEEAYCPACAAERRK